MITVICWKEALFDLDLESYDRYFLKFQFPWISCKIVSTTFTRYLEKKGIFLKNIARAFDKDDRLGDFRTF